MRRMAIVAAVCGVLLAAAGCFQAPVVPPTGLIYSEYNAPLTTEFDQTQASQLKTGQAYSTSILGLIAYGDCSLDAAAKDGGLSTIEYCDYSFFNVLGVYQKFTVVAHGK
jgi:hypothetical protein